MSKGKFKFKVVDGKHIHTDGKSYTKGQIVSSNSHLETIYPNKFQKVSARAAEVAEAEDEEGEDEEETTGTETDFGKDVSAKFEAGGLQVFRKGQKYSVVDPEDASTALNETPLRKSEVQDFISEYTG